MSRVRPAPGGGRVVEVEPARLPGWLNRFAGRNDGIADIRGTLSSVTVTAADGSTATLTVPFPPMAIGDEEPVQALLSHISGLGAIAVILVRAGAFSVGVAAHGTVLSSSTDTRYVQARTAAGGWSQQRYARRRGNQRRDAQHAAADAAHRVLAPVSGTLQALVVGGETGAVRQVLADPRLGFLTGLPRRAFTDIAEPRRAVLDEIAVRVLSVEVTIRTPSQPAGPPH